MVFLGIGYGVTQETWYPRRQSTGRELHLTRRAGPAGSPSRGFHDRSGTDQQIYRRSPLGEHVLAHRGQPLRGGAGFHNSVSVDQVAAGVLGKETRFASLQLNGTDPDITGNGHGPGLSLAWDIRGKPVAGLNKPLAAYHRLFSTDTTPIEERRAMLVQKRSVLDAVLDDARDLAAHAWQKR